MHIRKGDYKGLHTALQETRSDRMLEIYDSYQAVWSVNRKDQIKVRDSLEGDLN